MFSIDKTGLDTDGDIMTPLRKAAMDYSAKVDALLQEVIKKVVFDEDQVIFNNQRELIEYIASHFKYELINYSSCDFDGHNCHFYVIKINGCRKATLKTLYKLTEIKTEVEFHD